MRISEEDHIFLPFNHGFWPSTLSLIGYHGKKNDLSNILIEKDDPYNYLKSQSLAKISAGISETISEVFYSKYFHAKYNQNGIRLSNFATFPKLALAVYPKFP